MLGLVRAGHMPLTKAIILGGIGGIAVPFVMNGLTGPISGMLGTILIHGPGWRSGAMVVAGLLRRDAVGMGAAAGGALISSRWLPRRCGGADFQVPANPGTARHTPCP